MAYRPHLCVICDATQNNGWKNRIFCKKVLTFYQLEFDLELVRIDSSNNKIYYDVCDECLDTFRNDFKMENEEKEEKKEKKENVNLEYLPFMCVMCESIEDNGWGNKSFCKSVLDFYKKKFDVNESRYNRDKEIFYDVCDECLKSYTDTDTESDSEPDNK